MAPCPLRGKELTLLTLLFFGDDQRLGPSGQGHGGRGSQLPGHCIVPAPLLPHPWSCFLQRRTKPPPQPGPCASNHCPSKNMPERCPLLAAGILRTARGETPTRVHGCPLVAVRGIKHQVSQASTLWKGGLPVYDCLSGQHLQFQVN